MTKHPPKDLPHTEAVQLISYASPDDEIDLVDLWRIISRKKHLLFLGVLFAWLAVGAWLLLAKPEYEAVSRLLPPTPRMLAELSIVDDGGKYTPAAVFRRYTNHFVSVSNKREFFDQKNLLAHFSQDSKTPEEVDLVFRKNFSDQLELDFDRKQEEPEFAMARFVLDDGRLAAQWLNQYVDYVQQVTLDEIFAEIERRQSVEKNHLKGQIAIKVSTGQKQREDQITRLEEALRIATKLDIKTGEAYSSVSDGKQTSVEVNTQDQPLYMRGIDALSAELEALKARESDEAFIPGLRGLEEQLAQLEILKPDKSKTRTVAIDQRASVPEYAKNKKLLPVLALSTFLGLLLGLLAVFLQRFLGRVREAEESLGG